MQALARKRRTRMKRTPRTLGILFLNGGEKLDDGFFGTARRLHVLAQSRPRRKPVLAGDDALRVGQLDRVRVAECLANTLDRGGVAFVEGFVECLRLVLEMIE